MFIYKHSVMQVMYAGVKDMLRMMCILRLHELCIAAPHDGLLPNLRLLLMLP